MHKKSTLASAMLLVCALVFMGFSSSAQSCNTELSVANDFDVRAAQVNDPTRFSFEITNNSMSSVTYQISSSTSERPCRGEDGERVLGGNVELDHSFFSGGRAMSAITVPARTTATFLMEVSVPRDTPSNRWSCIDVRVVSTSCPMGVVKSVRVFVSNPSEN
jgi:hypothetical protein